MTKSTMSFMVTDLPDDMLWKVFERIEADIANLRLVCKRFKRVATRNIRTVYFNHSSRMLTKKSAQENFSFFSRVGNYQTTLSAENLSVFALKCIGRHLSRFRRVEISIRRPHYSKEFFLTLFHLLSKRLEVLKIRFVSGWTYVEEEFASKTLIALFDRFVRRRSATLRELSLTNESPEGYPDIAFFVKLYPALKTCAQLTHLTASFRGTDTTELELTKDFVRALPSLTSLNVSCGNAKTESAQLVLAFLQTARAPHTIRVDSGSVLSELAHLVDSSRSFPTVRRLSSTTGGSLEKGDRAAAVMLRLFPGLEYLDAPLAYTGGEKLPSALKSLSMWCGDAVAVRDVVSLVPPRLEDATLIVDERSSPLLAAELNTVQWQHLQRLTLELPKNTLPEGLLASLAHLSELRYVRLGLDLLRSLEFGPYVPMPALETLLIDWDDDPFWEDDEQLDFACLSRAYPSLTSLQIPLNPDVPIAPFESLLRLRKLVLRTVPSELAVWQSLLVGMPDLRVFSSVTADDMRPALLEAFFAACPPALRAATFGELGAPDCCVLDDWSKIPPGSLLRWMQRLPRFGRLVMAGWIEFTETWEADFRALLDRLSVFSFIGSDRVQQRIAHIRAPWCSVDLIEDEFESSESETGRSSDMDYSDGFEGAVGYWRGSEAGSSDGYWSPPAKRLHRDDWP